jgi:D-alanine--poly(phosphoribitol) ligase subunit 2
VEVQTTPATAVRVVDILARVTGIDEVRSSPDLALFELGILDSLGTVQLIIALGDELGIDIAPSEIEREQWATPGKIVAYVEQRMGSGLTTTGPSR